jgi:hypothetical protein
LRKITDSASLALLILFILFRAHRLLEMQVLTCELVGKFSFALPEDHDVRPRFAATLLPTGPNGEKTCPLYVTRVL